MNEKFSDLSRNKQESYVHTHFTFHAGRGWCDRDNNFVGETEEEVIAALFDLEEAEIAAIGDCMCGSSMIIPKLLDFVRHPVKQEEHDATRK